MLFKLLFILHSLVVLARTKECKPGQYCESRCCTLPGGDVQCRERCLGSSCELDGHCDGDCCVNSICTSCLLKRLFSRSSSPLANSTQPSTDSSEITDEPKVVSGATATNQDSGLKARSSPTRRITTIARRCSNCPSGCCIDGRCVDISRCKPIKAARGGRGGGRSGGRFRGGRFRGGRFRGGRFRGGGGGWGGSTSGGSGGDWPPWAWGIFGGVMALVFILALCKCLVKRMYSE